MTLTATVDTTTASVKLLVDFHTVIPDASYNRVTVKRADGTIVRGLDNAVAPGGMTRGIDHEAPLGASQTYTATVTNGSATLTPSTATATLAAQTGLIWIKSLLTPALSVQVYPQKYPDWTRGIPQGVLSQFGDKFPSVSDGTRQAGSGTLTVLTTTLVQRQAVDALLDAGGPYLIQFTAQSGEADVYARIGAFVWQRTTGFAGEATRAGQMPLTVVKRPSTGGSAVSIPGSTFQDSLNTYATFNAATGVTFGSP